VLTDAAPCQRHVHSHHPGQFPVANFAVSSSNVPTSPEPGLTEHSELHIALQTQRFCCARGMLYKLEYERGAGMVNNAAEVGRVVPNQLNGRGSVGSSRWQKICLMTTVAKTEK
jgi:hypothetical protein